MGQTQDKRGCTAFCKEFFKLPKPIGGLMKLACFAYALIDASCQYSSSALKNLAPFIQFDSVQKFPTLPSNFYIFLRFGRPG